jgi:heme/copper-type cytochrome/quinol oxidase subunit 2
MPYFSPTDVAILVLVGAGLIALYWGYRARKSSRMPPEKKARVFKYGWLAGLVMIVLGISIYAWEIMSPITPEKIVQAEHRRVTLPMDIDEITRWESVKAAPQRVIYTYTVHRIPRDQDGLANALRQQITQSVCADQVYRAAIKRNISFEFVYKFTDESYPAITLSPAECAG